MLILRLLLSLVELRVYEAINLLGLSGDFIKGSLVLWLLLRHLEHFINAGLNLLLDLLCALNVAVDEVVVDL